MESPLAVRIAQIYGTAAHARDQAQLLPSWPTAEPVLLHHPAEPYSPHLFVPSPCAEDLSNSPHPFVPSPRDAELLRCSSLHLFAARSPPPELLRPNSPIATAHSPYGMRPLGETIALRTASNAVDDVKKVTDYRQQDAELLLMGQQLQLLKQREAELLSMQHQCDYQLQNLPEETPMAAASYTGSILDQTKSHSADSRLQNPPSRRFGAVDPLLHPAQGEPQTHSPVRFDGIQTDQTAVDPQAIELENTLQLLDRVAHWKPATIVANC